MSERDFDRLQRIVGPVSRETFEALKLFQAEFIRWAGSINLAAASTLNEVWDRHILDSAQLARLAPAASRWLDAGSGGGFPGAVLAILLTDREFAHVDLIESNRKKAAFLQTMVAKLGVPGCVHACRIENAEVDQPEIVTARALAPLPLLLNLSSRWLSAGARGLFHKGRGYRAEVEESRDAWRFDLVEHPSAVSPEGVILEIIGLRRL